MNATFRPHCLHLTRQAILRKSINDLTICSPATAVLCLSGPAGSGKSAIVTTLAEDLLSSGHLGAFLFFEPESDPGGIIRTWAHKLAMSNSILNKAICAAIEQDPDIANRTLRLQFRELLLTPMRACSHSIETPVITILDAFEQCGDARSREPLIQLLSEYLPQLPPMFRVLISGRPECQLAIALSSHPAVKSVSLEHAEWRSAEDVQRFIRHKLQFFGKCRKLELDWPGEFRTQELEDRVGTSFVLAAPAMDFLWATDTGDEDESLRMILHESVVSLADLCTIMAYTKSKSMQRWWCCWWWSCWWWSWYYWW